jgi:hypothetical protein
MEVWEGFEMAESNDMSGLENADLVPPVMKGDIVFTSKCVDCAAIQTFIFRNGSLFLIRSEHVV